MAAPAHRTPRPAAALPCCAALALLVVLQLLPHACVMAAVGVDEEAMVVLRGSGPSESASFMRRAIKALEDRAGRGVEVLYRSLPTTTAARADFVSGAADFAMSVGPLPAASHAAVGGMLHIPIALHSVSFFFNVPGSYATLNMTACTAARVLTGAISKWDAPEIKELNPAFRLVGSGAIKVVVDGPNSPATLAVDEFLRSPAGCPTAWAGSFVEQPQGPAPNVPMLVMSTGNSFGYALSSAGNSVGLRPVALKNADGAFVTAATNNATATRAALLSSLPASFSDSFHTVSSMGMAGKGVYPLMLANYLLIRTDQSNSGAEGQMLRAFAELVVSPDMQALLQSLSADILLVGTALASAAGAAVRSSVALQSGFLPFTLEAPGAIDPSGTGPLAVSGNRMSFETESISTIMADLYSIKSQLAKATPKVMRGSGSSAVQLVMWKLMDQFAAMASSPVWMSYRPIGSGGGESEFMGDKPTYAAYTDFGASDLSMSSSNWQLLKTQGVQVVHLPICVAPMSFFFNWPKDKFPKQELRMSSCTVAKVMQGDIKTWDDPAIAAENPGLPLPSQPIVVAYRGAASGTTAVVSQYLANTCADWKLGADRLLTGWPQSAYAARNSEDMASFVAKTPYTIGYMDAGFGIQVGMSEVYLPNKDGVWHTSSTADRSAAAAQLFQSGGWPTDPTDDFSKVTLLNLPGNSTWPISAMPFMFVRTDATARGASGVLLRAFLTYFMSTGAQTLVKALHFGAIPVDILTYVQERALPLLRVDTRQADWTLELGAALKGGAGAGDNVISLFKSTYGFYVMGQLNDAQFTASKAVAPASTGSGTNLTGVDITSLSQISGLDARFADLENQIKIYQSVAIAAVAFASISLGLVIFVGCRMFVAGVGAVAPGKHAHSGNSISGASFSGARPSMGGNGMMNGQSEDLSVRPSYTFGSPQPAIKAQV